MTLDHKPPTSNKLGEFTFSDSTISRPAERAQENESRDSLAIQEIINKATVDNRALIPEEVKAINDHLSEMNAAHERLCLLGRSQRRTKNSGEGLSS